MVDGSEYNILWLPFKIFRIFTPIVNSCIPPYLEHANAFVQILSLDQMLNNKKAGIFISWRVSIQATILNRPLDMKFMQTC